MLDGIQCSPSKVKAVQEWPVPKTVSEVRSFVGLATWFRKFIQGFSNMERPLTNLTCKDTRFEWDDACQKVYPMV